DAMLLAGDGEGGGDDVLVSTVDGGWWQVRADGRVQALPAWLRRRFSAVCADGQGQLWACLADGERWRIGLLLRSALAPTVSQAGGPGAALAASSWSLPEPVTALAWQADGSRLLAVTPESGTLYALLPGDATVRRLATVPKGSGRLAGLALEADGAAWCALKGGWSVARFAPDGSLDRIIGLPVPCPTGVALVGPPGALQLCVPSAREGLFSEVLGIAPASGRVLALRLQPA
ncbi:SMP-30/gluconolactonase/LRE family protein, partial [Ideonella sp.]|uniref:SMP-30/gluconolactonase/LRE family protein n=1 Tax=Ideonella sp. TaxID=1929293 RepID=UPI003BB7D42F